MFGTPLSPFSFSPISCFLELTHPPPTHLPTAIPTTPGQTNHTPGFTHASSTEEAHTLTMKMCKALASVCVRVLVDEGFYCEVSCEALIEMNRDGVKVDDADGCFDF